MRPLQRACSGLRWSRAKPFPAGWGRRCRPGTYGAAHKPLCLQPGAGSLAAFQTIRPRQSFSGAGEGFLASRGVQGDGSRHPDGNSTQPQPCTPCVSQQRVLHEQVSQNTPFCFFPNPQLPQALLPLGFWGAAKTEPCPTSPTMTPPRRVHVPATGSAGVNAPKFPFAGPTRAGSLDRQSHGARGEGLMQRTRSERHSADSSASRELQRSFQGNFN